MSGLVPAVCALGVGYSCMAFALLNAHRMLKRSAAREKKWAEMNEGLQAMVDRLLDEKRAAWNLTND